ncbi:MAG TPA: acyl carrier protein [Tissierellia bacterium]|nr:acyl carrier protein [Tissierellia bacterium]
MLQDIILEVLSDYVEFEDGQLTPETHLVKDLELSSYDRICLMGDLERRLGVEVPEERIARLSTLGDVADLLVELKA